MIILIEIDSQWTFGVDWLKHVKGFRLGFIAIHLVTYTVDALLNYARKKSLEEEGE